MKLKFFLLSTLALTLSIVLISCSNSPKKSRTILGELATNSPVTKDFSKFSGTESYKFTISEPTTFNYELKIRTGKTSLSLIDENGKEYFSINSQSKDSINLNPEKETTYFVDLTYDNGVGSYSLSIEN